MAFSPQAASSPLATGYSSEVDLELLTFVERYATNLARWDLLLYFGRNPDTCEDARGIARQIGRKPRLVAKELDDLVYLGVLHAFANGNGLTYQLAHSPVMRRTVVRLARHSETPR